MPEGTGSRFYTGTAAAFGAAPRETLHNARKGYMRVLYPYHPYYGRTLEVFGVGGGLRDLVYVRMPNNTTRGIPAWMFDESICASVRCADRAIIDFQALLRLAQLLDIQLENRGIERHESSVPRPKIACKISSSPVNTGAGKSPLNGQIPSGVRSKCVALLAELLRSVVFKNHRSERGHDE